MPLQLQVDSIQDVLGEEAAVWWPSFVLEGVPNLLLDGCDYRFARLLLAVEDLCWGGTFPPLPGLALLSWARGLVLELVGVFLLVLLSPSLPLSLGGGP